MKPTVRAAILAAFVNTYTVFAAGIYVDPCGGVHNFPGGASATIFCLVAGGGESNAAGTGVAGQNFFENHLSPVRDVGTIDGNFTLFPHTMTTFPTWDAGVTEVPTHLGLDGEVKLFTTEAFVSFAMTGMLGGPQLVINLTVGPFPNCPCSIFLNEDVFGKQAPAAAAIETLTVTIFGRARYDAEGSPSFDGAVPEPGSLILMAAGLLAIGVRMRLRRR